MDLTLIIAAIGAVGALVTSLSLSLKNLAETRSIKLDTAKARAQLSPNHGTSLHDSVTRVESAQVNQSRSIGGIRDDMRLITSALQSHMRDSQGTHESLDHRLARIEGALVPTPLTATSPATIIKPPQEDLP